MFSVEEISLGIGTRHPIKSDFVPKKNNRRNKKWNCGKKFGNKSFAFCGFVVIL
jgi:hypothetical protein